jgi:DNA-binding transcriptional LysR family regulator
MDRLKSMEVFVATVERGSLAAAARVMRMTAPMAGKHVRALEHRLGLKLVHRTTRRQSLTEAGRRYFARCKQHLRDIDDSERAAAGEQAQARGELRVASPVSFGSTRLASALPAFLARYPEVSVELVLEDSPADLIGGGFDAAIRIGALADSSLVARSLAPYTMAICASPAYLKRRGTPRTPADLSTHDCLGYSLWDRGGGWALGRKNVPLPASRLRANNGQALRSAALAGAGVVMQPESLLAADIAAGKLVPLLAGYLRPPRPMHLVYARDRQAPPKLARFVEFVLERFGRHKSTN